ncbi:hypothetical protein CspHIS471_0504810 [Cutaneotrichosporon sp. HIS471]|nr:hypothetical protein CspHIS471_0504810 [Cutaneotrichosporon sp. HIS471]
MPKVAVHFGEHALILAGQFTDNSGGGCNKAIVDAAMYATILEAKDAVRLLKAANYAQGVLGDSALAWPHQADQDAWHQCYGPLFANDQWMTLMSLFYFWTMSMASSCGLKPLF